MNYLRVVAYLYLILFSVCAEVCCLKAGFQYLKSVLSHTHVKKNPQQGRDFKD